MSEYRVTWSQYVTADTEEEAATIALSYIQHDVHEAMKDGKPASIFEVEEQPWKRAGEKGKRRMTNIYFRRLDTREIVGTVPVRLPISDTNLEKAVMGMLRNMRDGLYVDTSEVDDARAAREEQP
jgi:hypothetical protein